MKSYVGISLFEDELHETKVLWRECAQSGCDGIVVGMRDAVSSGLPVEDRVSFKDQCILLARLLDSQPVGLSLVLGPQDATAIDVVAQIRAEAVWLPPPVSHQPTLVRVAAGFGMPVLAAVNGLGPQGFDSLRRAREGAPTTFCYVAARGEAITATLMQLAWLRAQGYPMGLVADDEVKLQSAAALRADVVIVSHARIQQQDWQATAMRLRGVAEAARGSGSRPITWEEIDGMLDGVPSLVAARRLAMGSVIMETDIAIRAMRRRGLAPFMLEKIIGRRLRYGLEAGEPISFGFLKEPGARD